MKLAVYARVVGTHHDHRRVPLSRLVFHNANSRVPAVLRQAQAVFAEGFHNAN
jgi:hypothetical protein